VTIAAGRDLFGSLVPGWASRSAPVVTPQLKPVAWWVVGCSALLPTMLTAAWLVADVLQPPSYSPVRQTVSVLSGYAGTDRSFGGCIEASVVRGEMHSHPPGDSARGSRDLALRRGTLARKHAHRSYERQLAQHDLR
jgi:hypothetical protein